MIIWFSIILKPLGNDDHSPERLRKENYILNLSHLCLGGFARPMTTTKPP